MAVYDFPPGVYPYSYNAETTPANTVFRAESGATQTLKRSGALWTHKATFRNLREQRRILLRAMLTRLDGAVHRINLPIFDNSGIPSDLYCAPPGRDVDGQAVPARGNILYVQNVPTTSTPNSQPPGGILMVGSRFTIDYSVAPAGTTEYNTLGYRMHEVMDTLVVDNYLRLVVWPAVVATPFTGRKLLTTALKDTCILASEVALPSNTGGQFQTQLTFVTDLLVGTPA